MTGPIKPPGGPKFPTGAVGPDSARSTERAEAFGEALQTQGPEASKIERSGVAAELEAGRIDGAEAVERLVAEALESPMAAQLSDAGRRDLEAHLRTSLEDDPNLAALVRQVTS